MALHRSLGPAADVTREQGQDLLVRELSGSVYQDAQPSLLQRALSWLLEQLGNLLPDDLDGGPVVTALLAAAVVGVVVLALRVGSQVVRRRRRSAAAPEVFAGDVRRTAEQHRRSADERAGAGDWPAAVTERFRALVRGAEERVLLDERPGRTATEAATELAGVLPGLADDLRAGAHVFDDVVYGSAPGSAGDDARLRALDERVRSHRPAQGATALAPGGAPR